MPKIPKKSGLHGMRGKLDGLVYRKVYDETIVQKAPGKRPKTKITAHQKQTKQKWEEASRFGKMIDHDPVRRIAYAKKISKKLTNVYTVARTDFLNPPKVLAIFTHQYTGKVGSKIMVEATDDFQVASVTLVIRSNDDRIIESGDAVNINGNNIWYYITTQENLNLSGTRIMATAMDNPQHKASLEKIIE